MKDGPNIVGIAALVGDHARAEMLTASGTHGRLRRVPWYNCHLCCRTPARPRAIDA